MHDHVVGTERDTVVISQCTVYVTPVLAFQPQNSDATRASQKLAQFGVAVMGLRRPGLMIATSGCLKW